MRDFFNRDWKRLFSNNRREIEQENAKLAKLISIVMTLVMLMVFSVFVFFNELSLLIVYFVTAILMSVTGVFASYVCEHDNLRKYALAVIYFNTFLMYMFSMYIILIIYDWTNYFLYISLLALLPLIIIDNPYRKAIQQIAATAIVILLLLTDERFLGSNMLEVIMLFVAVAATAYFFGIHISRQRVIAFDRARRLFLVNRLDVGLYILSRRSFFEDVGRLSKTGEVTGVLMCDINKFKSVNDKYGHDVGDELLEIVAFFLKEFADTYGITWYRYGGDEFVGIHTKDSKIPINEAPDRLYEMMRNKEIPTPLGRIRIELSIGYAEMSESNDYEECLKRADLVMYEKKKSMGRRAGDRRAGDRTVCAVDMR